MRAVGLLGGLLHGGDDSKTVGGTSLNANVQFGFQSGARDTSLLESNISADNLLIDMVVGESELLGGGSGLGGCIGGKHSSSFLALLALAVGRNPYVLVVCERFFFLFPSLFMAILYQKAYPILITPLKDF